MARTEESRRKVGERTKAYMASLTPEARRELSMKAVKAKLNKNPKYLSMDHREVDEHCSCLVGKG